MKDIRSIVVAALIAVSFGVAGCDSAGSSEVDSLVADSIPAQDTPSGASPLQAAAAVPVASTFIEFSNTSGTVVKRVEWTRDISVSSAGSYGSYDAMIGCGEDVKKAKFSNGTYDYIRSSANLTFSSWDYTIKDSTSSVYKTSQQNPVTDSNCITYASANFQIQYLNIVAPVISLNSPANGATISTPYSATISWRGGDKFTRGKLYVGSTAGLGGATVYPFYGTVYSKVISNLMDDTMYFWKVELSDSRDASKSAVSGVRSFTTGSRAIHLGGSITADNYARLTWNQTSGASSYTLKRVFLGGNDPAQYFTVYGGNHVDYVKVASMGVSLSNGVVYTIAANYPDGSQSSYSNTVNYRRQAAGGGGF